MMLQSCAELCAMVGQQTLWYFNGRKLGIIYLVYKLVRGLKREKTGIHPKNVRFSCLGPPGVFRF